MDDKLTLKLDEETIEKAKVYAKNHKTSLSRLIENYLKLLTKESSQEIKITPLVKNLSGIIKLTEDFNVKKEYTEYLVKKYK